MGLKATGSRLWVRMQMTLSGLAVAFCMFMISGAKPLKTLSRARPHASPNNLYMLLSVLSQVDKGGREREEAKGGGAAFPWTGGR